MNRGLEVNWSSCGRWMECRAEVEIVKWLDSMARKVSNRTRSGSFRMYESVWPTVKFK